MFCRCEECLAIYLAMDAMAEKQQEEFERTMPRFVIGDPYSAKWAGLHSIGHGGNMFCVGWLEQPHGRPSGWYWRDAFAIFQKWEGPFATSGKAYGAAWQTYRHTAQQMMERA